MLFTVGICFYSTRLILANLGVENYGIFNVIGGFVSMFYMVTATMTQAVSRFLTFDLGRGDIAKLQKTFSTSVNILLLMSIVVVLLSLGIPYEVWQAGPVAKDVFIDLSDGPYLLKDYIKTDLVCSATYLVAVKPFCDDEFSECEIAMMDDILNKYGKMTAADLVNETHKKGTLWYQEASQNGLLEAFQNHECNNSDLKIDFTKAMAPCAAEFYQESLDVHQTANLLNINAHV